MHCKKCNHEKNRVIKSSRKDGFITRIRECQECESIWLTIEKVQFFCDDCGADLWTISRVEHNGPDQKTRVRTCKKCGNIQHGIEKKISPQIFTE